MNILRRLFTLGTAEANSVVDKLEDPIKMTEQGIRDLKADLDKALHALAEVKALSIRARNDIETYGNKAKDYEQKAVLLLQRAQKGDVSAEDADRLASEALVKKEESIQHRDRSAAEREKFETTINQLDGNIKRLRSRISQFENELRTLKARVKVSTATKNINRQMANMDSSSTVGMLERMKDKVAQEEALAESYGEIANESKSVDEEIDKALEGSGAAKANDELAALKKRMGMGVDSEDQNKES
jgi:phage shock protein A